MDDFAQMETPWGPAATTIDVAPYTVEAPLQLQRPAEA